MNWLPLTADFDLFSLAHRRMITVNIAGHYTLMKINSIQRCDVFKKKKKSFTQAYFALSLNYLLCFVTSSGELRPGIQLAPTHGNISIMCPFNICSYSESEL